MVLQDFDVDRADPSPSRSAPRNGVIELSSAARTCEGIRYPLTSAGSAMQMGLTLTDLTLVGAMAMLMYELFSVIEKHTTGRAHRGLQGRSE